MTDFREVNASRLQRMVDETGRSNSRSQSRTRKLGLGRQKWRFAIEA